MGAEEPMESGPATAGSDTGGTRGRFGTRRADIIARIGREVEGELARVRATARLAERDRIGPAGYLALLLAIFSVDIIHAVLAGFVYRRLALLTVALMISQSA